MIRPRALLGGLAIVLALAACDVSLQEPDSGFMMTPPPRFQLEVVSGDDQEAAAGATLAAPLVVRVVGREGAPLEGVPVEWVVTAGDGHVAPDSVDTNAAGLARAVWTLGDREGRQTVEARVWPVDSVVFSVVAR